MIYSISKQNLTWIWMQVVHNASIMNAIGATGLQLYLFGQAVSIPFWTDTWKPTSFYDKIKINADNGFHTLCLLGTYYVYISILII